MSRSCARMCRVFGLGLTVALSLGARLAAAQSGELAVGVARLGSFSVNGKGTYRTGGAFQAGVFGEVVPRLRIGAEFTGIPFYRPQAYPAPCPPGPICNTQVWVDRFSGVIGIAGAGQLDMDPKGRLFVTAGVGGDELFLMTPQFHLGVSTGIGLTFPFARTHTGVLKAEWTELLGNNDGPSRFVPISLGLRF